MQGLHPAGVVLGVDLVVAGAAEDQQPLRGDVGCQLGPSESQCAIEGMELLCLRFG